jgi:hypothetical protein
VISPFLLHQPVARQWVKKQTKQAGSGRKMPVESGDIG